LDEHIFVFVVAQLKKGNTFNKMTRIFVVSLF
jgi:hypothetical protein